MSALKFAKGGGKPKSPVRTPDTMVSTDTVEILLGISEGPIKGLEKGARSFMADDTPLENESGEANFQNFELDVWPGSEAGHVVTLDLGGFSNPKTIGVNLAKDIPVVRAGQTAGIDAVDFRIVVGQLLESNDRGTFPNALTLKFEVKKTTDAAWSTAWINEVSTTPPGGASGGGGGTGGVGGGGAGEGGGTGVPPTLPADRTLINFHNPTSDGIDMGDYVTYRSFGRVNDTLTFEGDIQAVVTEGPPVLPPLDPDLPAVAVDTTNGDNTYHWESGGGTWTPAPTTPATGYRVLDDGRRLYNRSSLAPAGARPGDLWINVLFVFPVVLVWNGGTWVRPSEYQDAAPPVVGNGIWSISDKVSSPTPKDLRVFLPNPGPNDMWEYRVTKLSDDTGTEKFSEVQWESVQEISRTPMAFSGVAMARVIGRASDQFTALPQWTGDWLGRVVKVASNYNPVTRVYTGIWDGLYKIEWTDNPAWVFQDFVENDRYGLSSVFPHVVNKWKIYEFAQHCDIKVLRPDGSLRPRWTYNDYIQEPRDAKELAQYIAGSAGARYVDDGNGIVEVVIDKDDPAIAIFTPENIGEDGFSYSYTDRLTRANEVTVEFVNPTLNWQRDKRIVRNDPDIATYGRIPENFIAVGCTDVDEALARARRRLIGGLTEKEIVTFTTNRKGRYLAEWSVVLLGDPEMGRGITGRIRAITGPRSVSLRDPLAFEPGIEYWASFDIVNPDYPQNSAEPYRLERRLIINEAGNDQTTILFASDLPDLPEYASFILEAPDVAGFPKPYRVTTLGDDSGTGDHIRVTCLEINRNKWAFIDSGVDQGTISYSSFTSSVVLPPKNPTLVISTRLKGAAATRVIEVRWEKSPSRWVRRYKVYHSVDGTPKGAIDATEPSAEVEGAEGGIHTFAIVAIDIRGRESLPLTLSHNVTGEARPVAPPTNLRLIGGLSATVFEDTSPKVAWDAPEVSPNFKGYVLVISNTVGGLVRRTIELGADLEYRYDFLSNKNDGAGTPERALTYSLYAQDQDNNFSPPAILSIINPAPAAPVITAETTIDGFIVRLSPSTDRDVVGALVWVSPTSGFNPSIVSPTIDGNQQSFSVASPQDAPRYVRAAYYDKFSKVASGLFVSTQITTRTAGQVDDAVTTIRDTMGVNSDFAAANAALTLATANLNLAIGQLDTELSGGLDAANAARTLLADRVGEIEVDVHDPVTGLSTRVGVVETATTGPASRLSIVEQQVQTPTTGLLARVGDLQIATANLLTGKADASRVQVLEASVSYLGIGRVLDAVGSNFTRSPTANPAPDLGATFVGSDPAGFFANIPSATFVVAKPFTTAMAGRTYEALVQVEQLGAADTGRFRVYGFDAAGVYINAAYGPVQSLAVGQHTYRLTTGLTGTPDVDVVLPVGTVYARVGWYAMSSSGAGTSRVRSLTQLTDVTAAASVAARTGLLETATANLETGKASATRVQTLETQVQTPTTGLLARVTDLQTATSNLETGKASAARVQALEISVDTPLTGLAARTGALETATGNLQTGKADASRMTVVEAAVSSMGLGRVMDPAGSAFTRTGTTALPGASVGATFVGQDAGGYYLLATAQQTFAPLAVVKITAGAIYEARVQLEQLVAADTGRWVAYGYSDTGAYLGFTTPGAIATPVGPQDLAVRASTVAGTGILVWPVGTVYGRLAWNAMRSAGGGSTRVRSLTIPTDVSTVMDVVARTGSLETTTANLNTGKADASRVTTLEATVASTTSGSRILETTGANFTSNHLTLAALGASLVASDPLGYYAKFLVATNMIARELVKIEPGRVYRVTVRGEQVTAANSGRTAAWTYNGTTGAYVTSAPAANAALAVGAFEVVQTFGLAGSGAQTILPVGTTHARFGWQSHRGGAAGENRVRELFSGDVSEAVTLAARILEEEEATADLILNKASASRVQALEVTVDTEGTGLTARVSAEETATADLQGRTMARWAIGAAVPGAAAFIEARAETTPGVAPTSNVAIGARQFVVYNPSGGEWKKALEVLGGNVVLSGGLQAGAFIRLGNGNGWPVALKAVDFSAADGEVVSFGTDLGALPSLTFAMNNLAPLGAGETYDVRASGLSATGFTLVAKINVPGTPTSFNRTASFTTTAFGTGGRRIDKTADANSSDGTYRVTANGTNRHDFEGLAIGSGPTAEDYDYGEGVIQVWAKKGGVWSLITSVYAFTTVDRRIGLGAKTVSANWTLDETLQLGDAVQEVGLRHAGQDTYATVSAFTNLRWTAPGTAGGVRTATPAGEKTRITVRPQ